MKTKIGEPKRKYTRGILSYWIELSHEGLKKNKRIQGQTILEVDNRAILQAKEWDAKWNKMEMCWDLEEAALYRSSEAKKELDQLKSIIRKSLESNPSIFDRLKDTTSFPEPKPKRMSFPPISPSETVPAEPIEYKLEFKPDISATLLILIPRLKRKITEDYLKKAAAHRARFQQEHANWRKEKLKIEMENTRQKNEYNDRLNKFETEYNGRVKEWEERRQKFLQKQKTNNDKFDSLKNSYLKLIPEAVNEYFTAILEISEYPDCIFIEFKIEYLPEVKTLLIDCSLPKPESIPTLKEVRYIKGREGLSERHMSLLEHTKLYDDILYQIALRTVHEVLKADVAEALEAVIFNGWVRSIDRSTGKEVNPCVMSLQTKRNEFMAINLANIDPKLCFKFLKGIGSSKLYNLAGIAPILQIQKDDRRFITGYEVVDTLEDSYNLAVMDWEDFEHLIRELFEKEFSQNGCEVKVTRASRDGGGDAIIFNPDPIHGGKIVIQAKRYTNPVGVSAVRDLYGTVLNEGANKGILVTTSDYGPDSYSFANGKPLTLLNGGNLLHLLEKHGHKARIDLQEAKH